MDDKHPDLVGKVVKGWDFINNDANPDDDFGHGTHVSGTIVANMNNGKGMAGISNGKVLAVKVLNAQGWGTDMDVAKGITFCANNPLVKVINLSLGGSDPGDAEFAQLEYAVSKGKLIVAAAGNSSMSLNEWDHIAASFPAGWASPHVCKDGTYSPDACASDNVNDIYTALLAVGAAGSPWGDGATGDIVWVDTNGDGSINTDMWWNGGEMYYHSDCAAYFSNYGAWVQIVAPGEDVYSTTPVSYPFWEYEFDDSWSGYDSWGGTSMATPHVAAAAARAWSVYPTKSAADMKTWLVDTGDPLTTAEDPNMSDSYTGYFHWVDGMQYWGNGYEGDAPYCWPDDTYSWEDMSDSVYLNVARAMNRGALTAVITDATTGMGTPKTTVTAYQGTVLKDTTKNDDSGFGTWYDLINLPATDTGPALAASTYYTLKVSNANTAGPQTFTAGSRPVYAGEDDLWSDAIAGVPPKNVIAGVLDWGPWVDYNLDLYLWLPSIPGGVVGEGDSGTSGIDHGPGALYIDPFARWNRDGGSWDTGMESISIVPKPGMPTAPYYYPGSGTTWPGTGYDFLVTDNRDTGGLDWESPVFRYWVGGTIKAVVIKSCDVGSEGGWWQPGVVGWGTGANFHATNVCGDDSLQPYTKLGGLSTASHK